MALAALLQQVDELVEAAQEAFTSAGTPEAMEEARIAFLGKKNGRLKLVQQGLSQVAPDERKTAGMRFNEAKQRIESAFTEAKQRLAEGAATGAGGGLDTSLPGTEIRVGRMHPLTETIEELKDIMARLGFTVAEGPEIEDEWHNFDALNIPAAHPARDPLENFYLASAKTASGSPLLLRSQTSTVQIRVMENRSPPVRIISLGRVYRPDTADATHYPMFHQMEGLLVDTSVTMADLKSVLRMFATSYLGSEVDIRFRPSFFPFTEPSVEADYRWNQDWVEFGGAGMVDPEVLRAVGYDPEQVSGFAFGLGVERLCMRRHNITDIREFYKNDVRFLEQF